MIHSLDPQAILGWRRMPLIKRYANRKLYDTDAKRYITLDGIA